MCVPHISVYWFVLCVYYREQIERVLNSERFPFILVGNKADLEDKREVFHDVSLRCANVWDVAYVETSAKTKNNVDKVCWSIYRNSNLKALSKDSSELRSVRIKRLLLRITIAFLRTK